MRRYLPAWAIAVSLNGFWVYLFGLEIVGVAPHTALTGTWYALIGGACLAGVLVERRTLARRLAVRSRPIRWFVVAAAVLAVWFVLNVLLVSHDYSLARTFAALLILWTLPTALLALSLSRPAIVRAVPAAAALGVAYALVEWGSIAVHHGKHARFSPVAPLDPISAAQFPAVGALALLAVRPPSPRWNAARLAALGVLVAGSVVPGSRGPIIALAAATVAVVLLRPPQRWLLLAVVAVGVAVGLAASTQIGSSAYLSEIVPGQGRISTLTIRREWWAAAVHEIPAAPFVGHGVAMFVDNTPEARQMGVAGERTYPHNSPLESLFSLGVVGAIPYLVFLLTGLGALLAVGRREAGATTTLLAAGLWMFAFVGANFSGEIGADAAFWAAAALAVGLYADTVAGLPTRATR
ncbi:MAG: O-antigen ligase family protein [Gaiellaceae bacterium]